MYVITVKPEKIFQALSDPIRIRVIRLLLKPKEEACLCELSEGLEEPEYKLSRHVKVLRQAGFLDAEKDGRWIYHKLVLDKTFTPIYSFIKALPDTDKVFKSDQKRFEKRKKERLADNRCRTESATKILSKKV